MTLDAGTKLGRYEIRSPLGAGGMGEVYLAQDTQLRRAVAIKLLPAEFSQHKERLARFEQEAYAVAALNHPNIAHIYEIGEADDYHFIVMEYVDGETLREKIHNEKSPLKRLLKWLTQVAEGLTKAHAAGVVHRDLKPDNVMISRDSYAKILDFGLAKLMEQQKSQGADIEAASEAATALIPAQPLSTPGVVMGTVGYMSPEQAQGKVKEIDHRSDIFSFGCILFEAATGQQAFAGDSAIDSLHKIIYAPVPSVKELNPAAPSDLQRIVRRCLMKEPEKRYQTMRDVANDLEDLLREIESEPEMERTAAPEIGSATVAAAEDAQASVETKSEPPGRSSNAQLAHPTSSVEYIVSGIRQHKMGALLTLAALSILITVAAFALYKFFGRGNPRTPFQNTKVSRILGAGVQPGTSALDISPDGKYVVYAMLDSKVGGFSLWVRQLASNSAVQVVTPIKGFFYASTFSHDGNFIYYILSDAKDLNNQTSALYRVPTIGGTPVKLLDGIWGAVTLSPDDKQMAYVRAGSLMIANADGSNERTLAKGKYFDSFANSGPSWSPDGKTIACSFGMGIEGTVIAVSVKDGKVNKFTAQTWYGENGNVGRVTWLSDGSGLIVIGASGILSSQIWFLSYPEGVARRVTNDTNVYGFGDLGVTADNSTMVVTQQNGNKNIWAVSSNEEAGHERQITTGRCDGCFGLSWTPDGRIVYDSLTGDSLKLWTMNADGTNQRQLSSDAYDDFDPFATRDGRYIVYLKELDDRFVHLWRMDADGGNQKPLINVEKGVWSTVKAISPDSKWVLAGICRQDKCGVWRVSIDGGEPMFLTDKASDKHMSFSPDGKMFVSKYYDKETNPPRVRLALFSAEDGSLVKVFDPPAHTFMLFGGQTVWSPDGQSIVYIEYPDGLTLNLWSQPLDGSPPNQLTHFTEQGNAIFNFAFSPDGKQIALSRSPNVGDVVLIKDLATPARDK